MKKPFANIYPFKARNYLVFFLFFSLNSLSFAISQPDSSCNSSPNEAASVEFEGHFNSKPELLKKVIPSHLFKTEDSLGQFDLKAIDNSLQQLDIFGNVEAIYDCGSHTIKIQLDEIPAFLPVPALQKTDQDGWSGGLTLAMLNTGGQLVRSELRALSVFSDPFSGGELFAHFSLPRKAPQTWNAKTDIILNKAWQPLFEYREKSFYLNTEYAKEWPSLDFIQNLEISFIIKLLNIQQDYLLLSDSTNENFIKGLGIGFSLGQINSTGSTSPIEASYFFESRALTQFWEQGYFYEELFDFRSWHSLSSKNIIHSFGLIQLKQGPVPFSNHIFIGGSNSLRGYSATPERNASEEMILGSEWRYKLFPSKTISLGSLGSIFIGLETVIGNETACYGNQILANRNCLNGTYSGLHILLPGFERFRIEIGLPTQDIKNPQANFRYQIEGGFFQKSVTQRWRKR